MRGLLVVALALSLQGCFFIWIPGSLIDSAVHGGTPYCVGEHTKVGDTISLIEGGSVVIKKLKGHSSRCKTRELPILAVA